MYDFVDTSDDASMDQIYVTYDDDEHVCNHNYAGALMMIMIKTMLDFIQRFKIKTMRE